MNEAQFEIIASLGTGATAEVFKARNQETDSFVALKRFSSFVSQDQEALQRLRDEVQILKAFNHPNVVKMLGEHSLDAGFCLELELVEGSHLRDWMTKARNPLLEVDLWILVQVARGLGAVHEKGIIHRDLKPENILISHIGEVKLSDFGLAKELNRLTMTRLGLLVGSLGYMAPEITEGEKACPQADLFSFGAVAYELLSGTAPITGETPQAILKKVMEPITPLSQVCPHVPPRIGQLIDQCLKTNKDERPESIWAVESEIMGYLHSTKLLPLCP
ncbi:MAG: serine/threonine-protein kinase, partial [Pseudomonadota bacterium]